MNRTLTLTLALTLLPLAQAQTSSAQTSSAQTTATQAVTAALANNADVKTAQANLDKAQAANRAAGRPQHPGRRQTECLERLHRGAGGHP